MIVLQHDRVIVMRPSQKRSASVKREYARAFRDCDPPRRSNPGATRRSGLLRGSCHQTRIGATRWPAMTGMLAFTPVAMRPSIPDRLAGLMYRMLRLIGVSVAAAGKERIPVAIATTAGGHRMTLLQR